MRRKTQRRLIILLFLAVVGLSAVVVIGDYAGCQIGMDDVDTPASVVENAIRAMELRDIDAVLTYFTPPAAGIMYDRLGRLFARCDDIEVGTLATILTADGEITARVRAVYDLNLTVGTATSNEDYDKRIKLIKNNGVWYINEAF